MKTLLRLFGLAFAAILLCVNFSSCKKSDQPKDEAPDLVGTWNWNDESSTFYPGNGTFEFDAKGNVVLKREGYDGQQTVNGTYTLTKTDSSYKLKIDFSEAWSEYMEGTITFSGNTAYYKNMWYYIDDFGTVHEDSDEYTMTLTKQ